MSASGHIELLAYFITFRCYGTWLHGDERGSVDDDHNIRGTPMLPADPRREASERAMLKHPPQRLSAEQREVVDRAVREQCEYRGWDLVALNVRTNHVHLVVAADGESPEYVMAKLKQRATRILREAGLLAPGVRMWSEHGSTIYLWRPEQVSSAVGYVIDRQAKSGSEDE